MSGDTNADGFTWDRTLRSWIPDPDAPPAAGGSTLVLLLAQRYEDNDGAPAAWQMVDLSDNRVFSSDLYSSGLADVVTGPGVVADEWMGSYGFRAESDGVLTLSFTARFAASDGSGGNNMAGKAVVSAFTGIGGDLARAGMPTTTFVRGEVIGSCGEAVGSAHAPVFIRHNDLVSLPHNTAQPTFNLWFYGSLELDVIAKQCGVKGWFFDAFWQPLP